MLRFFLSPPQYIVYLAAHKEHLYKFAFIYTVCYTMGADRKRQRRRANNQKPHDEYAKGLEKACVPPKLERVAERLLVYIENFIA